MLNIAFFDGVGWDYDVSTPYERPLGGSQSALAYLAVELARRARERDALLPDVPAARSWECRASRSLTPRSAPARPFDAFVVLNGPANACFQLRPHLDPATPLVLWTQHAADQAAMTPFRQPEARQAWDAVACVSQWHRTTMIAQYDLDPARVFVHRNAIAPCFEALFSGRDEWRGPRACT